MYDTIDIIDNISDHMPVLLVLSGLSPLDTENADNVVSVVSRNKPLWSVASDVDIDKYKLLLDCYLTLSDPEYFVPPECRGWYKKAHPYYFNN